MSTTFSAEDAPFKKVKDEFYHDMKKQADAGDEYAQAEIDHYFKFVPEAERGWEKVSEWPEVSIANGNDKLICRFLNLDPEGGEIKPTQLPRLIKQLMITLNTASARLPERSPLENKPGQMKIFDQGMDNDRARKYMKALLELFTLAKRHNKSVQYS